MLSIILNHAKIFQKNRNEDKQLKKKYTLGTFIISALLSTCTALMFSMNLQDYQIAANSALVEIFTNLFYSIYSNYFLLTVLAVVFTFISLYFVENSLPKRGVFLLLSAFIGGIWLSGESFRLAGSLAPLTSSYGQMVKSAVYLIGATYFVYVLLCLFHSVIAQNKDFNLNGRIRGSKVYSHVRNHLFWYTVLALLICWAFPVITCYPANLCSDSWSQLSQFWGFSEFTSHHPPAQTVIFGFFTRLGTLVGSANAGLYCFILVQTFIYATVIAYSFVLMKKLSAPKWLFLLTFFAAGFSPYYANRVSMLLKDNLYSIAMLLFVIELIYALLQTEEFFTRKYHYVLSSLSIIGVILFRTNGKHVLYPTLLLLIVILVICHKKFKKPQLIKGLLLLTAPAILAAVITAVISSHYNIKPGSIAEALSLPFQQTARCVALHSDEITEEERFIISSVLDYDVLLTQYNPIISDPVKATYNRNAATEELVDYLKLWFKMFFKYPQTYVEATLAQNYYLIYPFEYNAAIYMRFNDFSEELMQPLKEQVGLKEVTVFAEQKELLFQWFLLMHTLPVIGMLSHTATYTIALLFLIALALCRKEYKFILPAFPIFLSVMVIIIAPVIYGHPRYAFPIVYTVPVLIAYYIHLQRKGKEAASDKL